MLKMGLKNLRLDQQEAPENIYFIASGKGGVGKTWFSITFSQALGQQDKKILLCDGDLGLANIDIQLGLTAEKDLTSSLMNYIELKDVIIPYPQGGFDVIAGRSGSGTLATLPPQSLIYLREQLKKLSSVYDIILVDLGAGVGTTIQNLMQIAGQCIVVITDEPTSLMDAYAFIKVMHGRRQVLPMNIIINQAETLEAGKRTYEIIQQVCEKFLNMTPHLLGIIRRDPYVRDTICAQTPILTRYPTAPAAEDVKGIVQMITS
ncbi:hypothetical protein IM40_01850 [Candidatus Paracaedimonas acanthamoebae]|nr:hypothetical protein IM40_01850 [Candidatus Paracaedimonas acanthamoebae]